MAKNKTVRKTPRQLTKKLAKKKRTTIKSSAPSSSTRSGAAKKGKVVKAVSKSQRKGQTALKKKTVSSKTTLKKSSTQRTVAAKKGRPVFQKKKESGKSKKELTGTPGQSAFPSIRSAGPHLREENLSPTERYNVGGLFACAIDRASDPEFKRLRAILRLLNLSSQEKDSLLRVSQGMTMPKLFADGVDERKISQVLTDVIGFASAEGSYEKKWRNDIRQVGTWLGCFPQQFEQIEQKVLAK